MSKRVFLNICGNCNGYISDGTMVECPVCGEVLAFKPIDIKDKSKYRNLDDIDNDDEFMPSMDSSSTDDFDYEENNTNSRDYSYETYERDDDDELFRSRVKESANKSAFDSVQTVSGVVYNYKNTDNDGSKYSRLFLIRLYDAIRYGQRMEDVLHYFKVHVVSGKDIDGMEISKNVNVNAHGTIIGGAHIDENSRVTVRGKYKNGVLMATDIVDDESGSHIHFRRSYKAIATTLMIGVLILIGLMCGINSGNSIGGVFNYIGQFCVTLAIVYVGLIILLLIISFTKFGLIMRAVSKNKFSIPWLALFIVAFAITIFIMSNISGGLGQLSGSLTKFLTTIILYGILIYGIFLIIKG